MKDYSGFTAADFVQDDQFLQWVKTASPDLEGFWAGWLHDNPHKAEEVDEARRMILAVLSETEHFASDYQKSMMWSSIQNQIWLRRKTSVWQSTIFRVAALLLIAGTLSYTTYFYTHSTAVAPVAADASTPENQFSERINNSAEPLKMILGDGSSIVLQPSSSLRYPQSFKGDSREVYLQGEALFDIAKDARRPFLVYANELVTKVLGTSFSVRAYEDEPNVIVEVRSGKVSVFSQQSREHETDVDDPRREGLVLAPNQQAIYSREDARLVKSLFENPSLLIPAEKQRNFEFVDARMKDVFSALEESYGVEILYDEEIMNHCYLNASLTDESLQVKLTLICKAVNATYEIMDTHIIIYGKGCNE